MQEQLARGPRKGRQPIRGARDHIHQVGVEHVHPLNGRELTRKRRAQQHVTCEREDEAAEPRMVRIDGRRRGRRGLEQRTHGCLRLRQPLITPEAQATRGLCQSLE